MFLPEKIFENHPFSFNKKQKSRILKTAFHKLTLHHYNNCNKYKNIIDGINFKLDRENNLEEIPFLPVNIFKKDDFITGKKEEIFKIMYSSGTSGQGLTKIFLSKINAALQTRVLSKIVSSFVGNKRLPMLVIDSKENFNLKNSFSARAAAVRGFSIFAKNLTFVLNKDESLNLEVLKNFYEKYRYEKIIIFGFTFSVYKDFLLEIKKNNHIINFPNGILIHGGGWKKLTDLAVSNQKFKRLIKEIISIKKVHNYYGLIEQTGTIYMECGKGYFHSSNFSEILIRKSLYNKPVHNDKGMIQLLSPLAISYPGHNIITEDEGEIVGEDDCKCGKLGKYFKVHGRLEKSQIRGCSDAYDS